MKKQVKNNNLVSFKKQIIAILSLAAISLFLMMIDVCTEIYYYSQNMDAEQFPKAFTYVHICFALIELLATITILVLNSTTYCIYKKNNELNKQNINLFICNWFFSCLYIVLSIIAASLLGIKHPPLIQAFLAGFAVLPMVGMTTIGGMMFTSFNK